MIVRNSPPADAPWWVVPFDKKLELPQDMRPGDFAYECKDCRAGWRIKRADAAYHWSAYKHWDACPVPAMQELAAVVFAASGAP